MRRGILLAGMAALVATAVAAPSGIESLDPAAWREPASIRSPGATAAHERLRRALFAGDAAAVTKAVVDFRAALGPDVSIPEVAIDYLGTANNDRPRLSEIRTNWLKDCERRLRHDPWDVAAAAQAAHRPPPRLRDSQRMAEAYLATARLLGGTAGAEFRERALTGLRHIRSCQAKSGVFGYPYDPARTDRLGILATKAVKRGEKASATMVENGWIIDDLGGGDLQFENGVCGLAMLEAYAVTGDRAFLLSARRAADWAAGRPLVPNWNYNAFSARLLAGVYRLTKDKRYLEAAVRKYDVGVLPGQTESGRWLDPHNARTPYHAILSLALVDYVRLLDLVKSPRLSAVKDAATRALDNLAAQTITYGASNASEMLSLEAFQRGTEILGRSRTWDKAVHVTLNVLTSEEGRALVTRMHRMPEAVPYGLLQLQAKPGPISFGVGCIQLDAR